MTTIAIILAILGHAALSQDDIGFAAVFFFQAFVLAFLSFALTL